jgi:adenylate cyclase
VGEITHRPGWINRIAAASTLPTDSPDEGIRKVALVLAVMVITTLATAWVATYWALGLRLPAAIPLAYQVVSLGSLLVFLRTKRYRLFRSSQLLLMLLLPFFLQWSLGGFVASSGVILWSLVAPLGALVFQGTAQAAYWLAAFLGLLAVSGAIEAQVASRAPAIPDVLIATFFVLNFAAVSAVCWFLLSYFVRERELATAALAREREKSERLLLNVLPEPIAERLKRTSDVIADGFDEATVLFADIVDFTPLAESATPEEVVILLDRVFSSFDEMADRHGLEKIKTIGDAYMVAGGIPGPHPDHAEAVAEMALEMREWCAEKGTGRGSPIAVRIGIDSGPVVAGVIGRRKFIYDLWGDTVNTASRMESHGLPGEIQVTANVYERLRDRYAFRPRGGVSVKGKGELQTFLLVGPLSDSEGIPG